jgi:hypothetical protein
LLVTRVVLGAVVLALVAAGGASAISERAPIASANSMSFADPVGDSGAKPDISGGTVSNDDAGKITFTVAFANRPALSPGDYVEIFIDADNAGWTGNEGFEYVVQYSFDSNPGDQRADAVGRNSVLDGRVGDRERLVRGRNAHALAQRPRPRRHGEAPLLRLLRLGCERSRHRLR